MASVAQSDSGAPVSTNLRIRPMTRADLPACSDIAVSAFQDDELFKFVAPHKQAYPHGWYKFKILRLRERIVKPGTWPFVCCDGEEIVGYAVWTREGKDPTGVPDKWMENNNGLVELVERQLLAWERKYQEFFHTNWALSYENYRLFSNRGSGIFQPLDDVPHWHLGNLAVHPRHQRKGIGRLLMQWGFDASKEHASPITLIASPPGAGLYARNEFTIVDWLSAGQRFGLKASLGLMWDPETRSVVSEGEYSGTCPDMPAFVWDPSGMWVRPLHEGDKRTASCGRKVEAAWTDDALKHKRQS